MQAFIALLVLCSAVSCAIIPQPDPSADMYDGPAYDVNMQGQYPDPSMMTFDMDPSQEERPAYDMMAFGGNDDTESLDGDSPDARQFILRRVGITRTIIPGFGFGGLGGYGLGYGGFGGYGGYGGYGLGGYGGGLFFDEDPESQEDNEQVDDMEHGMGSGKREKLKIAGSDIKKVIIVMKKNPQDLSSSNQVNALEAQRLGTSGFDGSTFSRRHRKGQRNTIDESEIGHNLGSSTGSNLEGQLWNKDEAMRLKRMRMMHTSSEELNVPSESNNQLWGSAEGNIDNSMMTGTSGRRVIVVPQELLQNTRHTSSGMTSGSKKRWGSAEGNIDNSMMTGTSGRRVMVVPQEVYQNLAKKYYVPGTYNRLSKPENIDSTENMSTGFPTDSVVVKKVPHEVFEGAKVNPIDTSSIRRPNKIFKENPEMLNV